MIARILPLLLFLILLPTLYIDLHYLRHRRVSVSRRLLWWLPNILLLVFTLILASIPHFAPRETHVLNSYLLCLALWTIPSFVFFLCSVIGWGCCRLFRSRRNYGNLIGLLLVVGLWYVVIYGVTRGFTQLRVRHLTFSFPSLPAAFDGYRIVQFSDVHIGSYSGIYFPLMQQAIDSIHAYHPDMVVFTGDLQNREPREILPHRQSLSKLHAKDGVFSVMGNHDYPLYIGGSDREKAQQLAQYQRLQREMGWQLLLNSHAVIRRGADSIVIAGMENDGNGTHFPQLGDIEKTLEGVTGNTFVVMLQHDPTSWQRKILPLSHVQLTLSGHTHAMQFSLFGWSPSSLIYRENSGSYTTDEGRAINVSSGLGGFIPFRFGVPGEIVVITLKKIS